MVAIPTTSVVIAPPDERILLLTIKGVTGLICHNFSEKARKVIAYDQSQGAKKPRGARDPNSEYEASFYHLSDGTYGFPCAGFKKAAIRASKMVDGLSMTDARQMFFVLPDDRDTTGIDCVKINGTPSMRPELMNWSAILRITYDNGLISPSQIASLFYRAGYSVGVGDWRPERDGDFGRFTIEEKKEEMKVAA